LARFELSLCIGHSFALFKTVVPSSEGEWNEDKDVDNGKELYDDRCLYRLSLNWGQLIMVLSRVVNGGLTDEEKVCPE
jgi:hypothetical protein